MDFSSLTETSKWFVGILPDILKTLIVPIVVFIVGNVVFEFIKQIRTQIRALDYLTLYYNNLLQECLKLTNNEKRRKACLEQFINNPTAENYSNAFYIVRTPSLNVEIFAGDYTFTTSNYPQLINLIFEIDSVMKNILAYVHEANRHGDIAANLDTDMQIQYAKRMYNSMDNFHYRLNILIYLIDKILFSIKIYNSAFFHQKLVSIEFTGTFKELVDNAINELDEVNKFRNPNWQDSFIDSPDNPPIKLTLKNFVYTICLKIIGYVDKTMNSIRKHYYEHENKKYIDSQLTTHSFYSQEQIKLLHEKYNQVLEGFQKNKEKFENLNLKKDTNYFLYKGYIRRLEQIVTVIKDIFSILPPERKKILSEEEIYKVTIDFDYIATNFIPAVNNLFQFMVKHFNPNEKVLDIYFLSDKLRNYVPKGYFEHLQEFVNTEFYKFNEGVDESIAYNLPFELATYEMGNDNLKLPGVSILQYGGTNKIGFTIHEYATLALTNLNKIAEDVYNMILSSPKLVIVDERILNTKNLSD